MRAIPTHVVRWRGGLGAPPTKLHQLRVPHTNLDAVMSVLVFNHVTWLEVELEKEPSG